MTPENQAKLTELEKELSEMSSIPMLPQELNLRKEQILKEIRLIVKKNRIDSFLINHDLDPERYSVEGGDDDRMALLDRTNKRTYLIATSLSWEEVHAALAAQCFN